jgi:multiple sugar transport system ATP-binding protein
MVAASLSLRGLTRLYGPVRAVDDLDLEVPEGAFVTLLGPSGCGKSTTLNLIAGLDEPTAGTIMLGDRDVTNVPPNERRMAMVFQNYALYPSMTVFENIGFSLKLRHRPAAEISERVTAVAEMLDIGHLLHRKPAELSGGQQQRVALGRALVKQPLVFLLDEPFSNLDASLRARMRTEVKHLHLALGTTSVFVTHDQEEAMTLSDLICVMRDGKIVQSGSQSEIYTKPRNLYVAEFVGKPRMSVMKGSLEHGAEGVTFVGQGLRVALGPAAGIGLTGEAGSGSEVYLGVRAEDVIVSTDASTITDPGFAAKVGLMEPIGSDTFVELEAGEASIVARVDPDLSLSLDQPVSARLRRSGIHLFASEGGERLN